MLGVGEAVCIKNTIGGFVMRKKIALILGVVLCCAMLGGCGASNTSSEASVSPSMSQTPEPTQEALPDPTATPTSEPEEVTDAKALYDDVFAPIVNHEKWGTSDMLEDTVDNSGYEYKKEKGEPNRYTIYSKSSKKTHVYVSYLERDTGIETPMTVTFVLDGDEIATMGNYSSDGSVGYDKLTVNDTEVQSTSLARSIIFE